MSSVLIVDDEVLVRSFLKTALEASMRVYEAADGEHALELLSARAGEVDLALIDHILPRRSGLELLQIIKQRWPWIPVVILTGFSSEQLAVQALRAGASDYLTKPIAVSTLLQTVARLLTVPRTRPPAAADLRVSLCRADSQPRRIHPNIRRALDFMSTHLAERISLADVAREAGLSRFHFSRLFHRELGVPFHEYLHDLRVRWAQILLADRYLSISEIAYTVGFNDLSHFDRTFRKKVGLSPSKYRASLLCA